MGKLYTLGSPLANTFGITKNAPLDDRLGVRYIADLTDGNDGIAALVYKGMVVYVQENNSLYVYVGSSSATWQNKKTGAPMNGGLASNWVKIDSFLDPSVDLQYYAEKIGARIFETEDELTGTIDSPYRGMFAMVIGDSDETTIEETGLYILLDEDNTNPDNWLRIDPDYSNFVTKDELGDYAKKEDLADYLTSSDLDGYVKFDDIADLVSQDDIKDLAKKSDLDGFIKMEDLPDYLTESDLDVYLKVSELPTNVSTFINDAGYLTEHQDLSGYVKVEDLVDYLTASDLDDYAKKSDIPDVSGLASREWVEGQGYLKEHQDLRDYVKISDLVDFLTSSDISDVVRVEDLKDYLKVEELPVNISAFINDAGYLKVEDLVDYLTSSDLDDYVKKSDIPTRVSELTNDAGYITSTNLRIPAEWNINGSMRDLIDDINDDTTATPGKVYLGTIHLNDLPYSEDETWSGRRLIQGEARIEIMASQGDIGKVINFTLTSTLKPYHWEYTSSWRNEGEWISFLTEHQDISGKADKSEIPTKVSNLENDADYLTGSDLVEYVKFADIADLVSQDDIKDLASKTDLEGFIKMEDLPDYLTDSDLEPYLKVSELPTNVSAFINDAGYIRLADLPDFLMESDLDGYVKVEDLTPYLKAEDIADLAKKSDLDGYVKLEDAVDFLTSSDLEPYATKEELKDYLKSEDLPINVSDFINDAGYLTQHQDLSDYATKEELPTEGVFPDGSNDGVAGFATVEGVIEYVDTVNPEPITRQQILDLF